MANRPNRSTAVKESVVSEQRVANGGNGLQSYTFTFGEGDYDFTVTYDPDAFQGADIRSVLKLAQKGYGHVMSNESASAVGAQRKKDSFDGNEEAFLHTWRTAKRQAIVDGSYTTRTIGPRMGDFESELMKLIDTKLIKPIFDANGEKFPKSGTAKMADGQTLSQWRKLLRDNPKYAALHDEARANVEQAKQMASSAKAAGTKMADALAALL